MQTQKLSISLPKQQYEFVEDYQTAHHYKTRSAVIREALGLLQQQQLAACYQAANAEIDPSFDITTAEGIAQHETW